MFQMKWRPIADAPKDRRLLLCNDDVAACGRWVDGQTQRGWRLDDGRIHDVKWFMDLTKP